MITLTNLIPSPSMEGNGWNGTYSTEHSYVGTRSLKMSGASGSAETTCSATASIPLIPSHTYYARVYGYQDSKTNGAAVGFYWPIAEPNFNDNLPVGDAGKWNLYSAVNNRTSFSSGSYPFRLDWNNRGTAGTIYYDGCMLIDLTACFGAGNEPTKEWMDENIPFFMEKLAITEKVLPDGYTRYDYIQSSGTQYIDTGFKPNQNTRVAASFNLLSSSPATCPVFGARTGTGSSNSAARFFWRISTTGWRTDYNTRTYQMNNVTTIGDHTVDYNKNTVNVDGRYTYTFSGETFQADCSLLIFAGNNGGTPDARMPHLQLYSFQIYDNGTLIRDFIPCSNPSGAVGLYDIVEGKFYGNAGTGAFSHGAEMVSILGTVIPAVKSAVITPNPTAINQSIKISISVYEQIIILYPEVFYSGEIQSGEV